MLPKNLCKIVASLIFSSCGVVVHDNNDSVVTVTPNYLRYSIYLKKPTFATEVARGCINLDDSYDHGRVEIEDEGSMDRFTFDWRNSFTEIQFRFEQNNYTLSDTHYNHSFFRLNEVDTSFFTRRHIEYRFVAYADPSCF